MPYKAHGNGTFTDVIIANNTFYGTSFGIVFASGSTQTVSFSNVFIENNIFYNQGAVGTVGGTYITCADDTTAVLDNNDFYKSTGATFRWCNPTGQWTTYTTLTGLWPTNHPAFTHNSMSEPIFTDGANGDFTLSASNTVAKTSGADLSALTDMPTFNGVAWPYDKAGTARTGAWSMGAYQYTGASDTTPPAAPSGLAVS